MHGIRRTAIIATLAATLPLGLLMAPVRGHAQPPGDPPPPREDQGYAPRQRHPQGDRDEPGVRDRQVIRDRREDRVIDRRDDRGRLSLSDEQRRRIDDIRFSHRKRAIEMRANLETASLELGRLMRSDAPDRRAIDAQIDRIAEMRASLIKERVAGMFEVRSVLTPEQRREWREGSDRPGMGPGMPGMRRMHGERGPGDRMERGPRDRGMNDGYERDPGEDGSGSDQS
ncbi:MAG TPA: Spy/CpxP family protein refolding chaperone [Candidatus Udaeobacter sp.]|jgi:hypothetical protein|nr:Spy/CpxP family protein refolding chaperone [Candidatus Udaeobacter sp.]